MEELIEKLSASEIERIDNLLLDDEFLQALLFLSSLEYSLQEALSIAHERRLYLSTFYPERFQLRRPPSYQQLHSITKAIQAPILAIETSWDGDTEGWVVVVAALCEPVDEQGQPVEHKLAGIRNVPPTFRDPDKASSSILVAFAEELATKLAHELGVEFHSASPEVHDLDARRWWQKN